MIRPRRTLSRWFLPFALISAAHVALLLADSALTYPTKLLLMPALGLTVLAVVAAQRIRMYLIIALLLAAIAASWLGDGSAAFFPMFDDELPMMLASFGVAHVLYMVAFWKARDVDRPGLLPMLAFYAAAYAVFMTVLFPHTGALCIPVLIYGLVLAGTALLSTRVNTVAAWGGFWFLCSDATLAFRMFWPKELPGWTGGLVMATYTLGQGLIAGGLLRRLAANRRSFT